MNTVAKGNRFEAIAYSIINKALHSGQLGIDPKYAKLFQKQGYYSGARKKDIIFDITIEVWPENATRASLIYYIECKDYNHKIPVDDVTLFKGYINEVSGVNSKGVFIARGGFQSGAYDTAESYGMMLISVEKDNTYDILLYSKEKGLAIDEDSNITYRQNEEDIILRNLSNLFTNYRIERSLKKLSKFDINRVAEQELLNYKSDFFDGNIHSLSFKSLKSYIEGNHKISVHEGSSSTMHGTWGIFDSKNSIITLNKELRAEQKIFVLAHEFGHAILHRNTLIAQNEYNGYQDSQYNFQTNKHTLSNPKNWIEWQANYFAASLLMHKKQIDNVQYFHQKREYGRYSSLYLDDQYVNIKVFNETIKKMAYLLGVSRTSLLYRLNEFSMIINNSRLKSLKLLIDDYIDNYFT